MNRRDSFVPAIVLIAIGGWFLLTNLGYNLPGLAELWPVFIIVGGVGSLWGYASGKNTDPGQIFAGIMALGVGVFFLAITMSLRLPVLGRIGWGDLAQLWPVFLLIAGTGFLGQFIFNGFKNPGTLLTGVVVLGVGAIAMAFTLGLLSRNLGAVIFKLWPVALIVLGIAILAQSLFKRN